MDQASMAVATLRSRALPLQRSPPLQHPLLLPALLPLGQIGSALTIATNYNFLTIATNYNHCHPPLARRMCY